MAPIDRAYSFILVCRCKYSIVLYRFRVIWPLTVTEAVNKVASACFFHIRRLKHIWRLLGPKVTATLISAFMLSRLDYCNAVLAGLPDRKSLLRHCNVQRTGRLILRLAPRDHVTAALHYVHQLPVQYRISIKSIMHLIHIHKTPSYLAHSHSNSISQFSWTASDR